jgi:hypothetical protein
VARSFLTAINLNKNELQNAAVQNLGTAPSAPVKGQLYFDSTGNVMYWWSGTAWIAAMDAGGSGFPGYAPGGSTVGETTFGQIKAEGTATTVARADHTHGTPVHNDAAHSAIHLSALAAPLTTVEMDGWRLVNLGEPVNSSDSATKFYVDAMVAGLSWKQPVRVATTANLAALSGLLTIDGVTVAVNDRILVKDQTAQSANGVYMAGTGLWGRSPDTNTAAELLNCAVLVSEGTVNADTGWVGTANAPITLGTTALPFVQFSGSGSVVAGAGMTQSGSILNVIAGDATLTVAADSIVRAPLTGDVTTAINAATIAANVVDNTKLADMPGLRIKGNSGGTAGDPQDLTTTQVKGMLGVAGKAVAGSTAGTSTVAAHGLNSQSLVVSVFRAAAPYDEVDCDIEHTDNNNVTVRFATAVAANEYWIVMVG